MKDLRILFMGTPDFAVHILKHILKENHTLVGVVTAPDKPSGRGQKMHASAVKRFALKENLPVFQPKNLKSDEFQETLKTLKPDISVVVAFRMLPKKVWNFPKYGTFNLHASLLPDYRGAAPINWAIINGETKTGVTTFFLDEKIDTGKIILQEEVEIQKEDTAGSLHDKLMYKGAEIVNQTLELVAQDKIEGKPQPENKNLKAAPKLNNDNTKIDWKEDIHTIYNLIKGLSPYPVAWTQFTNGKKEMRCKIYVSEIEKTSHDFPAGKVVKTKTELKVAVDGGFISIKEMQLPGKKKIPIKQLLNGLHLKENSKMW